MNLEDYSQSVVSRAINFSAEEGVGVIDIATIIAIVLPILTNLPCMKPKTAEEKREWVEEHPRMAVLTTAKEIRKQAKGKGEKVANKKSKELAETIISDYLDMPDDQIKAMGLSI